MGDLTIEVWFHHVENQSHELGSVKHMPAAPGGGSVGADEQRGWASRRSTGSLCRGYGREVFTVSDERGLAGNRVTGWGSAELRDRERGKDQPTVPAGTLPAIVARLPRQGSLSTRSARFPGTSSAGATGLEPATSGVTGRIGPSGYR